MIKKIFSNTQVMMFCSYNCYSLWKLSPKRNTCDNCAVFGMILYHLGMSDGTLRSFCGQDCLMKFQLQFKKVPVTPSEARPISKLITVAHTGKPVSPVALTSNIAAGSIVVNGTSIETVKDSPVSTVAIPLTPSIESGPEPAGVAAIPIDVTSSAGTAKLVTIATAKSPTPVSAKAAATTICQVVFTPPERPKMCNKMTMYVARGPITKSKSAMCSPITFSKSTQTDFSIEEVQKPSDATFVVSTVLRENENSEEVETVLSDQTFVVCHGVATPGKRKANVDGSEEDGSGPKRQRLAGSTDGGSVGSGRGRAVTGSSSSASGSFSGPGSGGGGGDKPPTPSTPPSPATPPSPERKYLKKEFGVNAWRRWACTAEPAVDDDPLSVPSAVLGPALAKFISSLRQGATPLPADTIYYLCLGIQDYLRSAGRVVDLFSGSEFQPFIEAFDNIINSSSPDPLMEITGPRIEEEHLWEAGQLGPHSPWTLISTLIFFNTKYFQIDSVEGHKSLCMSHIMKHWKRGNDSSRSTLVYYPPTNANASSNSSNPTVNDDCHSEESKKSPRMQVEDTSNPVRCPIQLYEYYMSKCCDSVKGRGDAFYLLPEVNVSSISPTWYTTEPLPTRTIATILGRFSLVKETYICLR